MIKVSGVYKKIYQYMESHNTTKVDIFIISDKERSGFSVEKVWVWDDCWAITYDLQVISSQDMSRISLKDMLLSAGKLDRVIIIGENIK